MFQIIGLTTERKHLKSSPFRSLEKTVDPPSVKWLSTKKGKGVLIVLPGSIQNIGVEFPRFSWVGLKGTPEEKREQVRRPAIPIRKQNTKFQKVKTREGRKEGGEITESKINNSKKKAKKALKDPQSSLYH